MNWLERQISQFGLSTKRYFLHFHLGRLTSAPAAKLAAMLDSPLSPCLLCTLATSVALTISPALAAPPRRRLYRDVVVLKGGQCHQIFDFWFFSWISFPQAPEHTIRAISNFFKNSRRFLKLNVCHRRWQMQKMFNHKSFNYLVWTPLGRRVNL
jgi:hypothetical protein